MVIKYLVIKFSNRMTQCTLLSLKDDMAFWKLLKSTTLHDLKGLKLLFKASDNDYSSFKFHRECDNEGATITFIQTNHGHIYGGYASKSWTTFAGSIHDENTFLFLIKSGDASVQKRCPLIFPKQKKERWYTNPNVHHSIFCGPLFGEEYVGIPAGFHGKDMRPYRNRYRERSYDYGEFNYELVRNSIR